MAKHSPIYSGREVSDKQFGELLDEQYRYGWQLPPHVLKRFEDSLPPTPPSSRVEQLPQEAADKLASGYDRTQSFNDAFPPYKPPNQISVPGIDVFVGQKHPEQDPQRAALNLAFQQAVNSAMKRQKPDEAVATNKKPKYLP